MHTHLWPHHFRIQGRERKLRKLPASLVAWEREINEGSDVSMHMRAEALVRKALDPAHTRVRQNRLYLLRLQEAAWELPL